VHWNWADHCPNELVMFVEISAFPWLKLCRVCFDGDATEMAVRALEAL